MRFLRSPRAGTVAAVKKLFCRLLIVWLALVSGAANVHAISDIAHMAEHGAADQPVHIEGSSAQAAQNQPGQAEPADLAVAALDASQADACSQTHCGHGHTTGIVETQSTFALVDATTGAPVMHRSDTGNSIANMIERPNWRFATPAVVSHLS
jgi:hypothetical protein